MTYTLRFLSEVEGDAINGYSWYAFKQEKRGTATIYELRE
jgi:hypothetical protein